MKNSMGQWVVRGCKTRLCRGAQQTRQSLRSRTTPSPGWFAVLTACRPRAAIGEPRGLGDRATGPADRMRFLRNPVVIILIAIAIGCVAFPVTLHHLTLARIRETTFDAIRFAASAPEQLRVLPVTAVNEGEKVGAASVTTTGWEQYRMVLPHGEASTIIDIDLRSTLLPLMLGFGGWLRIVAMIAMSGGMAYIMIKLCHRSCRAISQSSRLTTGTDCQWFSTEYARRPGLGALRAPPVAELSANETIQRQYPLQHGVFLQAILHHLGNPAFFFDTHHQLLHWNDAAQASIPHLTLSEGIHMLDLSAHLPWGSDLVEKMDEVAQHPALIIHKGDSLCVIPG